MQGIGWRALGLAGILSLSVALGACGGKGRGLESEPSDPTAWRGSTHDEPVPTLAELEALLDAELERLGKDRLRGVSAAPADPENRVFDLQGAPVRLAAPELGLDAQAGGVLLSWTERIVGDYNQNGEVAADDLVPLVRFWRQTLEYLPEAEAGTRWWPAEDGTPAPLHSLLWRKARVDGDGSSEINASDITPIAKHFHVRISGYRLFRRGPDDAAFMPLDGVLFAAVAPEGHADVLSVPRAATFPNNTTRVSDDQGVHYFYFDQPGTPGLYEYFVAPVDAESLSLGVESVYFAVEHTAVPETELTAAGTAELAASPPTGDAPATLTLRVEPDIPAEAVSLVLWDFDSNGTIDAASGRQFEVEHTFEQAGFPTVTAYVLGPDTLLAVGRLELAVLQDGNHLPYASLVLDPPSGDSPLEVTLDASGSWDIEGIVGYEFDFDGDGLYDSGPTDQSIVVHTYPEGYFLPTVRITDTAGVTAEAAVELKVGKLPNQPPVAELELAEPVEGEYAPHEVRLILRGTDPEGGNVRLEIDYENTGIFTFPVIVPSGMEVTRTHRYSAPGKNTARLRVTDPEGLVAETTLSFDLLLNTPPVAVLKVDITEGPAPLMVTFDATESYDPDGHDLTFSWNFSGGTSGDPIAQFMYAKKGVRTAYLTVYDSVGASGTDSVEITTTSGWIHRGLDPPGGYNWLSPGVALLNVDNRPAIAYSRSGKLHYTLASDADGTDWPLDIEIGDEGGDPMLCMIGGRPAVAYSGWDGHVWYNRAQDELGTAWGAAVLVHLGSGMNGALALADIGGMPAVAFSDSLTHLWYRRATDLDGASWGAARDLGNFGTFISFNQSIGLTSISGQPALTISGGGAVRYVRALDSIGDFWSSPVSVFAGSDLLPSTKLVEAGGGPTVVYHTRFGQWSMVGTDPAGSGWVGPNLIEPYSELSGGVSYLPDLAAAQLFGGVATISAFSGFYRSQDAVGASWEPRFGMFDGPTMTTACALAEIDGTYAAVSDRDTSPPTLQYYILR